MKIWKSIAVFVFVVVQFTSFAQYNNDWIDYGQKYLKFRVVKTNLHQISYNTLNTALTALGETIPDPRNIQIFGRGKEVYLHIEGEADGVFDAADYIEFYAQHNDGLLDSALYNISTDQLNPYYSLISDTATYFLTWNSSTNNKRYQTINSFDFSSYTPITYFMKENVSSGKDDYYPGYKDTNGKTEPYYVAGEGWNFPRFESANPSSLITVETVNAEPIGGSPSPVVTARVSGINNPSGAPDHQIIAYSNSVQMADTAFEAYISANLIFTVPKADVTLSTTTFEFKNGSQGSSLAKSAVSYVKIRYSHKAQFIGINSDGYEFFIQANIDSSYLWFNNILSIDYIYNLSDHQRMKTTIVGSILEALIAPGNEKKCFVSETPTSVTTLTAVNSATGSFTDYSNPSISRDSAFLIIAHPKLWTASQAYESYRYTTGHDPMLINIEELYDQYCFGIRKNPIAIRDFSNFMINNFNAKYLFMIGKSVEPSLTRKASDEIEFNNTLIPTMGYNGSDNLITAGLNGTQLEPALYTGRLSAQTSNDINTYLLKVQDYERNPSKDNRISERAWMKNVMHFGGGQNTFEQDQFKTYLNVYKNGLEGPLYGGRIFNFFKTSSAPIQGNVPDSIINLIDNGVALMTFMGHSGGGSFDLSVDNVDDYSNTDGRYPFFTAVSCFAGNIHQSSQTSILTTSERFILSPNGAIGFLATVGLGYVNNMHSICTALFDEAGINNYSKPIGKCIQEAYKTTQALDDSFSSRASILEMTLHGDPAIIINRFNKPDYAISEREIGVHYVSFSPEVVTANLDSFDLVMDVFNLGRALNDSLEIKITRTFPNGVDSIYFVKYPPVFNRDTLTMRFSIEHTIGLGTNYFDVHLDPVNDINEDDDDYNNRLERPVELYISSSDLVPVYPYNYAIVPDVNITLKASTSDPFAPSKSYVFEIDTSDAYLNSTTFNITSAGGVIEWTPASSMFSADSTVYFWRTSPIFAQVPDSFSWRESSFQIISGENGWSQDHFSQFKRDQFTLIDHDKTNRLFEFIPDTAQLSCTVVGDADITLEYGATEYRINGNRQDYGICSGVPGIYVVVIDSMTLQPWLSYDVDEANIFPDGQHFGNANDIPPFGIGTGFCHYIADKYFIFRSIVTSEIDSLESMLANKIPTGNYLLLYTGIGGYFQSEWPASLKTVLKNLGADSIEVIPDSRPYIFFTKMGSPASGIEVIGDSINQIIKLNAEMWNSASSGRITSTVIGPAKEWGKFNWYEYPQEAGGVDSVSISLYGIDDAGNDTLLTAFDQNNYLIPDLSIFGADNYDYLRLVAYAQDNLLKTCAQLDKWQVYYDEIPEAALEPKIAYDFVRDTLIEGEDLSFKIAIKNISNTDMDSLRVAYWINDKYGNNRFIAYPKQAPLLSGQVLADEVVFNTKGLAGNNTFFIEANPDDSLWQLEQYHFNNQARIEFYVTSDHTNPLLDITFDGIHILNGDIVSPKPEILIQLDDENQFLALDDTSDFSIYLTTPSPNSTTTRIPFIDQSGVEILQFTAGAPPENKATVLYAPNFTKDGTYKLAVQANDASNNLAGKNDYSVDFEVINRSTITNIFNYPNPFSTSTQFVFTLTGAVIPDVFTIQILTITGKVIREITIDELGSINIGRNINGYTWDGTDEYGDLLANGVYLYKVITKINNEEIEQREASADYFFTERFGKLYIMR